MRLLLLWLGRSISEDLGTGAGAIRLVDQQVLHLRVFDPRLAKPMNDAALASCIPPTSGETSSHLLPFLAAWIQPSSL